MMKLNLIWLMLLVSLPVFAQENIPVGTWRSHFNYEQTHLVEEVNGRIYAASSEGLIYYDPDDNSLNRLSKIDGLSDVGITALAFDQGSGFLAIGYENGNIDILSEREILNVTLLKDSDITDSKRINDISFFGGTAYVSTDFGVLVVNPETGEIAETFRNLGVGGASIEVYNSAFLNDKIYLATEVGVLEGDLTSNINLQDFNNWNRFESSLISSRLVRAVSFLNQDLYASADTQLFRYDGTEWSDSGVDFTGLTIRSMDNSAQGLILVFTEGLRILTETGAIEVVQIPIEDQPREALIDRNGLIWYADAISGLSRVVGDNVDRFVPNGAVSSEIQRLELVDGLIHAFPISSRSNLIPAENGLGYSAFQSGSWSNILTSDMNGAQDITDLVLGFEDRTVISSFGGGVLDLSNNLMYDDTNSPLKTTGTGRSIVVTALETDSDGNIWVANPSSTPLHRLSPDGTWDSFSFGNTASENPLDLRINSRGEVWMILNPNAGGGILAFDPEEGGSRYITSANGGLPSTDVTDLEFDKNAQIWIATESGIAYFPFTQGVIEDNSIDVIRPVFGNRFLLEDEFISSLEVDEGNRKWIGTQAGLWLFEDAGDALVANFTASNSPLPSNSIVDIEIEPVTGEVFIATDMGMVSYRGDASEGTSVHQQVDIFPNPVEPGYTGLVGIRGLARDVTLKITNVSGRLVREINASGGGASWDLADYRGVRAQSGVYLVYSASQDGSETFVGKIAIVN